MIVTQPYQTWQAQVSAVAQPRSDGAYDSNGLRGMRALEKAEVLLSGLDQDTYDN